MSCVINAYLLAYYIYTVGGKNMWQMAILKNCYNFCNRFNHE